MRGHWMPYKVSSGPCTGRILGQQGCEQIDRIKRNVSFVTLLAFLVYIQAGSNSKLLLCQIMNQGISNRPFALRLLVWTYTGNKFFVRTYYMVVIWPKLSKLKHIQIQVFNLWHSQIRYWLQGGRVGFDKRDHGVIKNQVHVPKVGCTKSKQWHPC